MSICRAALIGTFNQDTLIHKDGSRTDSPGGLWYSLKALRLLEPDWDILPVAWYPRTEQESYSSLADELRLEPDGLHSFAGPGNSVLLDCRDHAEKPERAELNLPPLDIQQLEAAQDCDVVLLNCTSGRDVELSAWMSFRETWRQRQPQGWLQLDWHSLSLDWEPGRVRKPRARADAEKWLQGLDCLQCTLAETATIDGTSRQSFEDLDRLPAFLANAGCRRAVVSHGAAGIALVEKTGVRVFPAEKVQSIHDTTGCGDVAGAALLSAFRGGHNAAYACSHANRTAARILTGRGLAKLDLLSHLSP